MDVPVSLSHEGRFGRAGRMRFRLRRLGFPHNFVLTDTRSLRGLEVVSRIPDYCRA